jgi:hypothetical protein
VKKGEVAHNKGKQKADYPFGMYGSPTYISWNNMKNRCRNSSNPKSVINYQSRGIGYDPRWESFALFLEDMGVRPDGKTLERLDNSKGYYKSNCTWASVSQQNRNRRPHSNTGIKHISAVKGAYVVHVKPFKYKRFLTLEKAVEYKNFLFKVLRENIVLKEGSMLVDQITYTKRHNEGNYSHSEYTLVATIEEGDCPLKCLAELQEVVRKSISGEFASEAVAPVEEKKVEAPKVEEAPKAETPKRGRKPAAKETPAPVVEEDKIDGQDVPPVIPTDAAGSDEMEEVESPYAPKGVVIYDKGNKDHRDRLAAFLNKSYPNWKTEPKEKLKEFSASLVGKAFEDSQGNMLKSFQDLVASSLA